MTLQALATLKGDLYVTSTATSYKRIQNSVQRLQEIERAVKSFSWAKVECYPHDTFEMYRENFELSRTLYIGGHNKKLSDFCYYLLQRIPPKEQQPKPLKVNWEHGSLLTDLTFYRDTCQEKVNVLFCQLLLEGRYEDALCPQDYLTGATEDIFYAGKGC